MELREIADDVYRLSHARQGLGWANSGFVNRGGGSSSTRFWDLAHTRALIDALSSVSRRADRARREHPSQR
jgi:hypothetical protein